MGGAAELSTEPAFDYARQALIYAPADLDPPPTAGADDDAYSAGLAHRLTELVQASGGGAFFLFTSRRALNDAWRRTRGAFPYPRFRQGDAAPRRTVAPLPRGQQRRPFRRPLILGRRGRPRRRPAAGRDCAPTLRRPRRSRRGRPNRAPASRRRQLVRPTRPTPRGPSTQAGLRPPHPFHHRPRRRRRLDSRLRRRRYGQTILRSLPPAPVTHRLDHVQHFYRARDTDDAGHPGR